MSRARNFVAFALIAFLSGCQEFFSVEDVCAEEDEDSLPGGKHLEDDAEKEAMVRLTCYRRTAGLTRARINRLVQEAADGHKNYLEANPNIAPLTFGNAAQYLTQSVNSEADSFTGADIFERFDTANYTFYQSAEVVVEEFVYIAGAGSEDELLSGALAVDDLMELWPWREHGLQRSWIDGGYFELVVGPEWLTDAGACTNEAFESLVSVPEFSCSGGEASGLYIKFYYLVVVHNRPPVERMAKPLVFPKHEQTDVPLYTNAFDPSAGRVVQISWPITIFGNALNPDNYFPNDVNVFGLRVSAQLFEGAIADSDNPGASGTPIPTEVLLPGHVKEDVYPDGFLSRKSAAVFTDAPFKPSTTYTLLSDVETREGTYQVDIEFTTADTDIGLITSPATGGGAGGAAPGASGPGSFGGLPPILLGRSWMSGGPVVGSAVHASRRR